MMTPVGTAMLFRAFPPRERAKASAILAIPTLVAPTLGPILGGWLVDGPGWSWIFLINVPIGIAGCIFAFIVLKEHKEANAGRFDIPGFVLSGAGLALVLYALAQAPSHGWASAVVVGTGTLGIICFALMIVVELNVPQPMLDLRIFKDRMFRNSTGAFFMATAGLMGVLFLLPLYLQTLRGFSALESGLTTFPQALAMGACLQFTSRLYPKVGPRRMLVFGLTIATISSACFLFVGLDTSIWYLRGIMLLRGFGMSFAVVSAQTATFATITPAQMGRASSLFSTNRQVAAAVGVAILGTVLADRIVAHVGTLTGIAAQHATLSAFHDAFAAATILGVLSVAFAFLIHDVDAAVTLHRPAEVEAKQVRLAPATEAAGGS
jgi:EmrB/QacA subfamily drug resistance transporter